MVEDCLVPSNAQCIGRISHRGRRLVIVGDDHSLGRRGFIVDEEILELCCTYGRQNLGALKRIVCLRQLLADQNREDGGNGGG
jgi:hypothetical protein